jgi:hypothetical protein
MVALRQGEIVVFTRRFEAGVRYRLFVIVALFTIRK